MGRCILHYLLVVLSPRQILLYLASVLHRVGCKEKTFVLCIAHRSFKSFLPEWREIDIERMRLVVKAVRDGILPGDPTRLFLIEDIIAIHDAKQRREIREKLGQDIGEDIGPIRCERCGAEAGAPSPVENAVHGHDQVELYPVWRCADLDRCDLRLAESNTETPGR